MSVISCGIALLYGQINESYFVMSFVYIVEGSEHHGCCQLVVCLGVAGTAGRVGSVLYGVDGNLIPMFRTPHHLQFPLCATRKVFH